jgi:phenylacetate-CoA ligase
VSARGEIGKGWDALRVGGMVLALQRSQWWSRRTIQAYQRKRLVAMMRYAVTRVPYYAALNIPAKSLYEITDLQRFPLLSKRIVQEHGNELLDRQANRGNLYVSRTSGSSSEPTDTYFDRRCWLFTKYALKARRTALAGYRLGTRILVLAEQSRVAVQRARHGVLYSRRTLSVFEPLPRQYEEILSFSPHVIYGAPSAIMELIGYAEDHGLPSVRVPTLFTSSELLSAGMRGRIEAAFRGRVLDVYGSTEFKEVAFQCHYGRYHLNFESVYVETLAGGGTETGDSPALVISSLVNRAMPLLRFKIGDHARLVETDCRCGRHSPCLEHITGRETEYLTFPGGRRVSPYRLTTAIETCVDIKKYQIIQLAPDRIEVQVIVAQRRPAALDRLHSTMQEVLGKPVDVKLKVVDRIDRTPAGKYQIVRKATPSLDRTLC